MDPVVLSFHDSLLRRSDLALLDGPHWLNDQVIGFAFEFFSEERFQELKASVAFVRPELTQFIKCASNEDEVALVLMPLGLPGRSWVFLAVNDNSSSTAGGTHWSLLLYCSATHTFFHYDSQSGGNEAHARLVAERLLPALGRSQRALFVEESCPPQRNSYDCGMYVMCICEALCEVLRAGGEGGLEVMPRLLPHSITPGLITQKRREWSRLIQGLSLP